MPRIRHITLPAGLFGIVPGVAGLGSDWRLASRLWDVPQWIADGLSLTAVAVWALLLILYATKWIQARAEAMAEFRHPILCCYVGIVPVSTSLVAVILRPWSPALAVVLAAAGIVGQLAFGIVRTGELWMGGHDDAATTPILYLPAVAGSFVSAIVLSAFGHPAWGVPFFGIGMLSWLAIESVLIHRLYVVSELAPVLRPTLGIQLAPPAVGCVAYLSITTGPPDLFAQALMGYAIFQALILIRLVPWISRQPFSASYWAFTFGVSALSFAMMSSIERGGTGPLASAAPYAFAGANLVIGGIATGTLWLLLRQRLLPPPLISIPSHDQP
jgi:tellurite resistance protein